MFKSQLHNGFSRYEVGFFESYYFTLDYAEEIGLGSQAYQLVNLDD
jgi:uncharacterized Fe-S center protein